MCKVVAYYRVSTAAQGRSGLGLEAQQEAVQRLCEGRGWTIVASFTEVESGKRDDRPELQAALSRARASGAVLVVAKLDRLSRNAAFLLALQDSKVRFMAADNPDVNELTVGILAVIAQAERRMIASRTKAALAAAKARGVKLGNPNGAAALRRAAKGNTASRAAATANADAFARDVADAVAELRAAGVTSLEKMASALNERHIETPRGGQWHAMSVKRLLTRLEAA
jgi:DNA invertase Pin-like site-specific DNA recombinase